MRSTLAWGFVPLGWIACYGGPVSDEGSAAFEEEPAPEEAEQWPSPPLDPSQLAELPAFTSIRIDGARLFRSDLSPYVCATLRDGFTNIVWGGERCTSVAAAGQTVPMWNEVLYRKLDTWGLLDMVLVLTVKSSDYFADTVVGRCSVPIGQEVLRTGWTGCAANGAVVVVDFFGN